jgi:hypothetical protein
MIERSMERFDLYPARLLGDSGYEFQRLGTPPPPPKVCRA